ncbi:MAG: hypothetical protein KAV18_02395 [Candidatus Omnitrophica bacterium]|nr:hypothetical protein [Candidatus Omnitrophota bacterium]
MLSNKYPIDKNVFQLFYKGKDPLKVIVERINSFSKIELKKQARSLSPFLFDEHEADLIANVQDIILPLIEKYKIG